MKTFKVEFLKNGKQEEKYVSAINEIRARSTIVRKYRWAKLTDIVVTEVFL